MAYEIYACSDKARAKIEATEDKFGLDEAKHHRIKYPFHDMHIGSAFAVPFAEGSEASVRNCASAYARKTGKKFTVIRHNEAGVLEVARIQ